jgi:hypothetical protein
MFLDFIRKGSLILSLLAATCTYAQVQEIRCPSISSIQRTAEKIDSVSKFSNRYSAHYSGGDVFTENKVSWSVWIVNIIANSRDEAIAKGKDAIQRTNLQKQEYAIEINPGQFSCSYGPDEIFAYGHPLSM